MPLGIDTTAVFVIASVIIVSGLLIYSASHLNAYFRKKSQRRALKPFFPYKHKLIKSFNATGMQPDDGYIYYDTTSVLFDFLIEGLPDASLYPLEFSLVFKKDDKQYVLTKQIENYIKGTSKLLFALDDNEVFSLDDKKKDVGIRDLSSILAEPGLWHISLVVEAFSAVIYNSEFEVVGRETLLQELYCSSNLVVPVGDDDYETNNILCSNHSVIPTFDLESRKYHPSKFASCKMKVVLVDSRGIECDETPVEVKFNRGNMLISFLYEHEFSEGMWYFELHVNDKMLHKLPINVFGSEPKTKVKTVICGSSEGNHDEVILENDMHLISSKFIVVKAECISDNPIPWIDHKVGICVKLSGDKKETLYESEANLKLTSPVNTVRFRPFKIPKKCHKDGDTLKIEVATLQDDVVVDHNSVSLKLGMRCTDVQGRLVSDETDFNMDVEHDKILEEIDFVK